MNLLIIRKEEGQASEQGQIHCKDVPQRRFCHFGFEEPSSSRGASVKWKELQLLYLVLHLMSQNI